MSEVTWHSEVVDAQEVDTSNRFGAVVAAAVMPHVSASSYVELVSGLSFATQVAGVANSDQSVTGASATNVKLTEIAATFPNPNDKEIIILLDLERGGNVGNATNELVRFENAINTHEQVLVQIGGYSSGTLTLKAKANNSTVTSNYSDGATKARSTYLLHHKVSAGTYDLYVNGGLVSQVTRVGNTWDTDGNKISFGLPSDKDKLYLSAFLLDTAFTPDEIQQLSTNAYQIMKDADDARAQSGLAVHTYDINGGQNDYPSAYAFEDDVWNLTAHKIGRVYGDTGESATILAYDQAGYFELMAAPGEEADFTGGGAKIGSATINTARSHVILRGLNLHYVNASIVTNPNHLEVYDCHFDNGSTENGIRVRDTVTGFVKDSLFTNCNRGGFATNKSSQFTFLNSVAKYCGDHNFLRCTYLGCISFGGASTDFYSDVEGSHNISADATAATNGVGTQDAAVPSYFDASNKVNDTGQAAFTATGLHGSNRVEWAWDIAVGPVSYSLDFEFSNKILNQSKSDYVFENDILQFMASDFSFENRILQQASLDVQFSNSVLTQLQKDIQYGNAIYQAKNLDVSFLVTVHQKQTTDFVFSNLIIGGNYLDIGFANKILNQSTLDVSFENKVLTRASLDVGFSNSIHQRKHLDIQSQLNILKQFSLDFDFANILKGYQALDIIFVNQVLTQNTLDQTFLNLVDGQLAEVTPLSNFSFLVERSEIHFELDNEILSFGSSHELYSYLITTEQLTFRI